MNGPSIDAMSKMGHALEGDLKALLAYYGEDPTSPEAPKPEDFFGLVLSFSSSLQVRISSLSRMLSVSDRILMTECSLAVIYRKQRWRYTTLKSRLPRLQHPPHRHLRSSSNPQKKTRPPKTSVSFAFLPLLILLLTRVYLLATHYRQSRVT